MRRALLLCALMMLAAPLRAQDSATPEPIFEMTLAETEAVPGQMLTLRLTVLAPTFLPKPPVWPSFEAPNLLVLVPEGATGPTSRRVDGETWAGVTRRYMISPLVPGAFVLPPVEVTVTWADPDGGAERRTALSAEAVTIVGILPPGSEDLDPFIAADALDLAQEITGEPGALVPGDSVTRTVTARIEGVSPMVLPPLLPTDAIAGLRAYPDAPALAFATDRGVLSGSRSERVTLLAEGGGSGTVPGVSIAWYNLLTGAVETAEIPGFEIAIAGPPAAREPSGDPVRRASAVLAILLAAGVGFLVFRRVRPRIAGAAEALRDAWRASERHAWGLLRGVVSRRDRHALNAVLDIWAERIEGRDPRADPRLHAALAALGAARYGTAPADDAGAWKELARILPLLRREARQGAAGPGALPSLNPSGGR